MRTDASSFMLHAAHHACMKFSDAQQGQSLLETLFVLLILAVLCGVAISGWQTLQTAFHLQSSAEALYNAIQTTRTQALRLEKRDTLCAAAPVPEVVKAERTSQSIRCHLASDGLTTNAWRQGWLMFEDGNSNGVWDDGEIKLLEQLPLPRVVSVKGNLKVSHFVSYGANGRSLSLSGAFQAGTLTVCERASQNAMGWLVVVNAIGRPRLEKNVVADCPD